MNENHDHRPDHIQIKVDKLTTKIRKRAREEATRPVPRVYDDVVQEIASDPDMQRVAAKLPDYVSAVGHFTGLQSFVMCIL